MSGFTKGGRDFLDLGTYNLMCAYCGRKRKANELVRDDEFARGLFVCREHQDLRHPQEFARGIKEDMTVPFTQPPIVAFTSLSLGFPLTIFPSPIILISGVIDLAAETSDILLTEAGIDITIETAFTAFAIAGLPPWIAPDFSGDPSIIYAVSYAWSWKSGGVGITIATPTALETGLEAMASGLSGILQLIVVDSLGQTGIATTQVHS